MKIDQLLREAGVAVRSEGCRPLVEDRLREEFLRRRRSSMWRPWLIAVAAAAVLLAIVLRVPEPPVPSAAAEVSTEFFEIGPVVGDVTDAYIVRVRVPRATMASFGLPVNAEALDQRIEADLLVGTDGAARAIRFVHGIQ